MIKRRIIGLLAAVSLSLTAAVCVRAAGPEKIIVAEKAFTVAEEETHAFDFTLDAAGEYMLHIQYRPVKGAHETPRIGVSFDAPYDESRNDAFPLTRIYGYIYENGRLPQDDYGNERIPDQAELDVWQTAQLQAAGRAGYPLAAGPHRLYMKGLSDSVAIRAVELVAAAEPKSYAQYRSEHPASGITEYAYKREAELLHRKNDLNISLTYDRSSPNISPNSHSAIRYNLLAGNTFSRDGQWVSWLFDVPADGWYFFDFYYRQNIIEGMNVHRTVKINGGMPFGELRDVTFPATDDIALKTLGNNGEEYALYLQRGECELTLLVSLEPVEKAIAAFRSVITDLNLLSNKITVITGETVDLLRDYDLDKSIPGLTDTLRRSARTLKETTSLINGDGDGEYRARVDEAVRVLNKMADAPRDISKNLNYFQSQIFTLSNILSGLETQPLELDRIVLRSAKTAAEKSKPYGIWPVLWFRVKSFLYSFAQDYNSIGGSGENSRLDVWVSTGDIAANGFSTGRDHAQIVNELILDSYSPQTGVKANLSLVNSSETLMQAIASGRGPDAALFIPKAFIANLYFRDALVPLNEMKDFESVRSRFSPSSLIALQLDGRLFALPEIQVYQMLFYRTDLFETYGLTPPDTWEDFYRLVKQLQIEQMQVGIAESSAIFETLLLQSGGALYNGDCSQTLLTSQKAVEAFAQWTGLYSKYRLPLSFEMLNRFRTGQMPLVMTQLSFYSQLTLAAPEIRGLWAMAPIPATEKDGALNRAQSSVISGAVAIRRAGKTDYSTALKFLDWWTSAEIQSRFAQASENRIGLSGRYFPANTEAFASVHWTGEEREALTAQLRSVWDVPQTPASYYVQRSLSNAFRKVVYRAENPRDVIYRYGREMNQELTRKRRELGWE